VALINDEFVLPQSAQEFRGCINGYQVLLCAFLGVHSCLCITCKALTNEVDCITTAVVNMCLDNKVRRGICTLILAWTWRETDNCLTRMTNCRPPSSSPSTVAAAAVKVPACSDITEHLESGRTLCLTSLPPALFSRQLPGVTGDQMDPLALWQRPPATPKALPPPAAPPGAPPPPPDQARQQAVDLSGQNPRLKAAWAAAGHPNLCGEGSPFCDATQPSNRQAVMSLNAPTVLICLAVALRGNCFSACTQSHASLSPWDEAHVAQLGGLAL